MEINIKLTILFFLPAAFILLLVACGDTQPLPDIDATVEARVAEERAKAAEADSMAMIEATVQAILLSDNVEKISEAVERVYQLWNEERWSELWESYHSGFRDRCSFDDLVVVLSKFQKDQGIVRREVSRFNNINLLEGRATASFTVVGLDGGGREISTYDLQITLVREHGEWLWEERCH